MQQYLAINSQHLKQDSLSCDVQHFDEDLSPLLDSAMFNNTKERTHKITEIRILIGPEKM